jgi:cobalt-zinc-cadmium efflux system outer membrane protein
MLGMVGLVRCAVILQLLIGVAAWAQGANAPEAPLPAELSMADAEQVFLSRGLDLLIAQYGERGAEGDLRAAGAHPNPKLDALTNFTPATQRGLLYHVGDQVPVNLWGMGVALTDSAALSDQLTGKRSLRIEAASKALAAARLNVEDVKRMGLSQLRQAYVAAVVAALDVQAARDSFETFDEQLKLNQARYDQGAINALDLSRALQAQLGALQELDRAEAGRQQAMASLMFMLGVRRGTPEVTLSTRIGYTPLEKLQHADVQSLHELALQHRPDVQMAAAILEQSRAQLAQARRERVPDVSLSIGYAEQCNAVSCSNEPAFAAGFSLDLPVLYQQQGEIQRAESDSLAAERSLEKTKAQVLSDVAQAFAAFVAARSRVVRMEEKLLEQAKLSRDLAQYLYRKGAASFIDFLDAQRSYVAILMEHNQDLSDYWAAVYQLEEATGTPLR